MARLSFRLDGPPTVARGILTRRAVLQAAVAATAGCVLSPLERLTAAPTDEGPGRAPELSLGFGTYALKSFTTEEAIDLVAATGYDSIELCLLEDFDSAPEKLDAARRKAVRERLRAKSLRLSSLMENLPLTGDDAAHRKHVERLHAAFALARDLGDDAPPLVQTVLGGPAGKWPEVRERFVARLKDYIAAANAADVTLAVKPHRMNALSTVSEYLAVYEDLGQPANLKLVFDWSHYSNRGLELFSEVHRAGRHIGLVAVKDAVERNGKVEFVLPGAGGPAAGDYVTLLHGLLKEGYQGDVSAEVTSQLWKAADYDPRAAIKQCYDFLAGKFIEAQIGRNRRIN